MPLVIGISSHDCAHLLNPQSVRGVKKSSLSWGTVDLKMASHGALNCGIRPTVTLSLISNDSLSSSAFDTFHSVPLVPPCGSCACPDELYAQKLKYKAISEELDHALNDMTSM